MKVKRADVFVAEGGKEFLTEEECRKWELECKIRCVVEEWYVRDVDSSVEFTDNEVITQLLEVL